MGRAVVDLVGLVLVIGLIASGGFLMHSLEVTRSPVRVRVGALLSIVFMIAFMLRVAGW
jgi:hypothetical protein